jgi:hypothetical protein
MIKINNGSILINDKNRKKAKHKSTSSQFRIREPLTEFLSG